MRFRCPCFSLGTAVEKEGYEQEAKLSTDRERLSRSLSSLAQR